MERIRSGIFVDHLSDDHPVPIAESGVAVCDLILPVPDGMIGKFTPCAVEFRERLGGWRLGPKSSREAFARGLKFNSIDMDGTPSAAELVHPGLRSGLCPFEADRRLLQG